MSSPVITPVMGIELPIPGETKALGVAPPGQSWMELQNAGFLIFDAHDHTGGSKGLPLSVNSISIDEDLDMGLFSIVNARSLALVRQAAVFDDTNPLRIYVYGTTGDLYYNNLAGHPVRITNGDSIVGSAGSISGMTPGTLVDWYPLGNAFRFFKATDTFANIWGASIGIGDGSVASGKKVTIGVQAGLVSDYAITLPPSLPASQKFLTLDNNGLMAASWAPDGSTLEVSGTNLQVKNLGITGAKIANAAVTRVKQAAVGQQVSASTGSFSTPSTTYVDVTNATVTITTSGRPVVLMTVPDGSATQAEIGLTTGAPGGNCKFKLVRDSTDIGIIEFAAGPSDTQLGPGLVFFDAPAGPGPYVYKLQALTNVGTTTAYLTQSKLVAYEL